MKFRGLLLVTIISALLFESHGAEVCETDHCKAVANEFKKGMNESVDPCTDFYGFTCGSLGQHHQIDPWAPTWSRLFLFQQLIYKRLKAILSEDISPEEILPVRQAKKWYQACMDTEAVEKRGITPLETILVQIGGWPMTIDPAEWDENAYTWEQIEDHYFEITGSHIFYNIYGIETDEDSINVDSGAPPLLEKLPFEFRNLSGNDHSNYITLIAGVAQQFLEENKADVSDASLVKDADDLIHFERELSNLPTSGNEYKSYTFDEFKKAYDERTEGVKNKVDVPKAVKKVLEMIDLKPGPSFKIATYYMDYLVELGKLLDKTPKRTVVNYLHWHFVSSMLTSTTEKMREVFFHLLENEYGIEEREPRWVECIKDVKMTRATAYAYADRHYTNNVDRQVRDMIKDIQKEMGVLIQNAEWLDNKTKEISKQKLDNMQVFLGVPDWFRNKTMVLNSFKGLIINNNHFDNALSYKKFAKKQSYKYQLKHEGTKEENEVDPLIINAFYDRDRNSILLPAADFQEPLFTKNLPNYINYATAGEFIGHEIGHGFDSEGIKFGLHGEDTQIDKVAIDMYYKRASCFIKQFNDYLGLTEPPESAGQYYRKKNFGIRTQGENIADSTGFEMVYAAYMKKIGKLGSDRKLPGFEKYSDEQMFFISFGNLYCELRREKYEKALLKRDEHSTSNLRILGVISNNKDFGKVFNCPAGSRMTPENKCSIWKSLEKKTSRRRRSTHPWLLHW